jgi:hypothetical protein
LVVKSSLLGGGGGGLWWEGTMSGERLLYSGAAGAGQGRAGREAGCAAAQDQSTGQGSVVFLRSGQKFLSVEESWGKR